MEVEVQVRWEFESLEIHEIILDRIANKQKKKLKIRRIKVMDRLVAELGKSRDGSRMN
jgi:hypothetical protein